MKKMFYAIVLIGILICSISIEGDHKEITSNNHITYNLGERPKNLIMTDSYDVRSKDLLVALFQGLVSEDFNGEIVKGIADDYKTSEDGLEYTFTIRESAAYSNGDKITAQDFVKFFKSFIDDNENIYSEQLNCIFGVQDYKRKKISFDGVAIRAKDKKTLSIRLNNKCPYFIKILSHPVYALRDYDKLNRGFDEDYSKIRFTGPFVIDNINEKKQVIISKSLNYYDKSQVTDEKIKISFIGDKEKALAYFELKDESEDSIHIMMDSPINEYQRLGEEEKIRSFPSNSVYYLNFNNDSKNLVGDINFRNAINSILSKEYYAQQISKNFAIPAAFYVPKNSANRKIFDTFANKNESIEYLKKTKITGKENFILVYEDNSYNKRIAEDLAKNILQDIEISVSPKGYKKEELEKVLKEKQYDLYLNIFNPLYSDLHLYYDMWSSKSSRNVIGYRNEKYDEVIKAAKEEIDEKQRNALYRQCDEILRQDLPSVPIYYLNTMVCIRPNITGVYATALGNIKLELLKVE
ncbi:peptide/nickel transport system substrate-binding protein [Clostridium punense]|uniref:Peptide/nickel transport system substrate-binding protein n=1 Tax=Clostridium punense TaxID=1054297 RepID=A0ABS4K365_9CLOT|nr:MULTISPECIES: peptide ABC transporter substrate-binding protein [Clostridium]EQB90022.1 hypothetical protein M918_01960 [Clostridium sp. BL8]MBP2022222.1 peptide/nickel transport system substrate-binding protein [Clostridium punense]